MDQASSEQSPEEPEVGRRASESEHGLSKITHNALENMGALGHGLKQLFQPQRRRSSVSPHDTAASFSTGGPTPEPSDGGGPEVGDSPAPGPDSDPHATSSAPPAALSRVLQQIRSAPPMMKRGTSLQSRRSKTGGTGDPPQKGSPQIHRRSTQEVMLLQAGRPRSSSTTDTLTSPALADMLLTSGYHSTEEPDRLDRLDGSGPAISPNAISYGADSYGLDSVDSTPDPQRTKQAIAQLQQKILKLTEQIKIEQRARDDNVAEYLKLANNADKQQSARIKQVFEKKNQKSAQTIQQLQRKLERYQRKLKEVEHNGIPRQPKDVLRDMHQGLKDVGAKVTGGLSSFSHATHSAAGAVVSKPREIASLIRNKFGSADNISSLKDSLDEPQEDGHGLGGASSPKYGSEDDCSSASSGSAGANSVPGGPPSSKGLNTLDPGQSLGLDTLLHEVQELRDNQGRLDESFNSLKSHYQRDYTMIIQALQEERYRCERLEEQLNDLTELHQNEILNLKQELASMEEKITYQSYERARDIQEALEACQTRISKMELQQQQQQVVQLEGLENATARTLLGKLINVLLAVMAVLLVFVSTVANCVVPLMKTRSRTFSTLLLVVLLAFLWRNWEVISQYLDRFLLSPS
ncbi:transmembrane and coiled-coil domains protein 1 isoform X1 [Salmo salar]|uniref:Transmembrane and coiled-coil domains protein 1 isoform X1 n=2 Tax=Salmo salar TaxID=8030 RepID=A0A1S3P699_SALSA|nr:transmembrane and coiled-coil domains protein 1 isoform X1 [Salmo salar]XP_014023117.1 transmembrane and coiled-coil domains protein 1 isoform X1 [Salmo salar]XP_014023118.1 transmembrane and coiled-coil domains protein 1 isoform X1 [Salmo salar]XP_014023119.1 transmembrane and coiled-coil domains protein 1 isoform X1 [Salmo salar]XP_014023120.1 transmembrane and coiled-coil domains protein 1 isoform X1 [Salmo salar]XP_014023121.1 transmembrane and coiled-coil domains protein 1 isoform X1 [|eukprot:XP_014023116.1 PREDICTED: transmembrane and coiled-coil domains protein 1 isoform X1 [Salmo salar]